MKYIIVPELHKDKEHYHFHGLLANVDNLTFKAWKVDRKKTRSSIIYLTGHMAFYYRYESFRHWQSEQLHYKVHYKKR